MPPAPPARTGLTSEELRSVLSLSAIFGLRLLGLFMMLPVLSPYARGLAGATPFLAGLAVGLYGLSQTCLQIPVGLLSDRWGRKPVIAGGLLVYAAGCVIAAQAETIQALMAGRLIQGSGAIASVAVAMVADVTRDEVRTRAMAFIGLSVGISFVLGFGLGPVVAAHRGVPFLFWLLAGLDLAALVWLWLMVPEPARHARTELDRAHLARVFTDRNLLLLDLVNFFLHLSLTAVFVVTPFALRANFQASAMGKVYGGMILFSGLVMVPSLWLAEKRKRIRELLLFGLIASAAGHLLLSVNELGPAVLVAGLWVFFSGFNLQEPSLPALVTRFAPASLRGTAVGAFNMSQFLGSFAGGALGGFFLGRQPTDLFPCLAAFCAAAAVAVIAMDDPRFIREVKLETGAEAAAVRHALRALPVYDVRRLPGGLTEVRYSAARFGPAEIRSALDAHGISAKEA